MSVFRRARTRCSCGRDLSKDVHQVKVKAVELACTCGASTTCPVDAAWWVTYSTADGRRHRRKVGADRRAAERILAAVKVQILEGTFIERAEECRVSLGDAVETYYRAIAPTRKPDNIMRERSNLRPLVAFLGASRRLDKITPASVESYHANALGKGYAPATIERCCATLSAVLAFGVRQRWIRSRPTFPHLRVDNTRQTFLSGAQVVALAEKMTELFGPMWGDLVLYLVSTGCRRGEVLALRWEWVDLGRAQVELPGSACKSGKRRVVYCNRTAVEVLTRRRDAAVLDLPVFHDRGKAVRTDTLHRHFSEARRALGLTCRLHDLRHSHASLLAAAGESLFTISQALGHSNQRTTLRYSHLTGEHMARAVEAAAVTPKPEPTLPLPAAVVEKMDSEPAAEVNQDTPQNVIPFPLAANSRG